MNIKKKNIRPKKQGQKGHIAQISAPFYASNAMIVCSSCGKAARTGYKLEGDKKNKSLQEMRRSRYLKTTMNKFKEKLNKVAIPAMNKKFGYKNALAAPKITKVVASAGIGSFKDEAKKKRP